MAGKGQPKTGGRRPGSPNVLTAKSRKRFLRKATPTFDNLLAYLGERENWKGNAGDCLRAATKMLEWLVPRWKPQDSESEAAAAPVMRQETPHVSPADALAAWKRFAARGRQLPAPSPTPAIAETAPAGPLSVMGEHESELLRHQGIPTGHGSDRLIPGAPRPKRERREQAVAAEPVAAPSRFGVPTASLSLDEAMAALDGAPAISEGEQRRADLQAGRTSIMMRTGDAAP